MKDYPAVTSPTIDQQEDTRSAGWQGFWTAKREFWLLAALLTACYVAGVAIANRRFVWYDELLTFDIARAPSLHQLYAWVLRFESHLPTFYLFSRASMKVFGQTPFGLRFPSMIEFYLGSGALFFYLRRKAGNISAGLAVLLLWGSATFRYATEARPYALVFMCFALLLLSWDTAVRERSRKLALPGVALSATGMLAAHAFAPLSLVPFMAGEAVRFWRRRKPDFPLWAALVFPLVVMLAYIPMVKVYHGILIPTDDQASWQQIAGFFYNSVSSIGLALFLSTAALMLLPAARGKDGAKIQILPEELAVVVCLLLNPIALNLGMMLHEGGFYYRYCITTDAVIYVALAILLTWRLRPGRAAGWSAMAAIVLATLIAHHGSRTVRVQPVQTIAWAKIRPDLPLVAANALTFYEMNHHESSETLSRLYYLKDPEASVRYEHSSYGQDFEAPDDMKAAGFPIAATVEPYPAFVRRHREFLVCGFTSDWLLRLLQDQGATVKLLGNYSAEVPYPRPSLLYLVTMPK